MEGHLWKIIQKHLDDYGVREAEFARRIGTSPQTVSSWKKRGIRSLPTKDLLVGVSDVTRQPYDVVLTAVLHDIKYLPNDVTAHSAPTNQAGVRPADDEDAEVRELRPETEEEGLPWASHPKKGRESTGRQMRRRMDEVGEENQDPEQ